MKKLDKGIASMDIFVSVLVSLFLLGILIGIFAIVNSEFKETAYDTGTSTINETLATVNSTRAVDIANASNYRDCALTLTSVKNATEGGATITAGNYSIADCGVTATAGSEFENENWWILGSATHQDDNTGSIMLNDTTNALAGAVDWFPIIVVIAAVVVVLGLLVYVIVSVKRSGMTGSGGDDSGIGGA